MKKILFIYYYNIIVNFSLFLLIRLFLNIFYSITYACICAVNKRRLFISLFLSSYASSYANKTAIFFSFCFLSLSFSFYNHKCKSINHFLYYVLVKLASSSIYYLWNFNTRSHPSNDVDLVSYHVHLPRAVLMIWITFDVIQIVKTAIHRRSFRLHSRIGYKKKRLFIPSIVFST